MSTDKSFPTDKSFDLSTFTLDNLREAVLWITSDGYIVQVNDKTCQLSGYTKEELTTMQIQQLYPSEYEFDFPAYWQQLKKEKKLVSELQYLQKTGA
ncbi:MAG: PAS domain S-box protein, partial [Nitrososphaera sp.]|nr:PAS domain S-box protein [Nitrososphaera sp.]